MSRTAILQFPFDLSRCAGASSQDNITSIWEEASKYFDSTVAAQKRKELIALLLDTMATYEPREGEVAISYATQREVADFLQKLPPSLQLPDVVIEPDGAVALEWFVRNHHSFLVGFSGKGILTYAGLFGRGQKSYGTEIIAEGLSPSIVWNVRRLLLQC